MNKNQSLLRIALLVGILLIILVISFGSRIPEYLNRWGLIHLTVISAEGTYPSDDKKFDLRITIDGLVHYSVVNPLGTVLIERSAGTPIMRWVFVWGKDNVLWMYDDEGIFTIREDATGKWSQWPMYGKDLSGMPPAFKAQLPSSLGY